MDSGEFYTDLISKVFLRHSVSLSCIANALSCSCHIRTSLVKIVLIIIKHFSKINKLFLDKTKNCDIIKLS